MTKCTVIARCLIRLDVENDIKLAEQAVVDNFEYHFPVFNFREWNSEIDPSCCITIINTFGTHNPINIELLITHLWDA